MVKLTNLQSQSLHKRYEEFNSLYSDDQSKFQTSKDHEYYIVSVKYLQEWNKYCSTDQQNLPIPGPMNQDLMDAGGQLRKGLLEGQDFEVLSSKLYKLVRWQNGFELKRNAVFVGNSKKVPIYLGLVRYLRLSYSDIYNIDYKKMQIQDLKIKQAEFSHQDTVENFVKRIKQIESPGKQAKARTWLNTEKQLTPEKLFKYVKEKTERITTYKFEGFGKLMEKQNITIEEMNLEPQDYFLVEMVDEYSNFFLHSKDQSKCEGCYKYKLLPFVCGCKAVAYCTQQCQDKDQRFHLRDCKFAQEKEMNQQIVMKIDSSSALGKVGLSNLGNTCFMNSCLQCLSNTRLLTDYFLGGHFDKEVNKDNPLGSKGKLARNYAKFIKNMWCDSNSTFSPHNLKGAVAKINPIFSGYAQHDSQEFFSFIVDGLHQDLNRVLKKPYVESIDSKNRSDEVIALESWAAHTQRNQSIIVDLLTGQYKSKVICPDCKMESITFDPFTTVSLPIPEEPTTSELKYFVVFNDNDKEALKTSLQYIKGGQKEWLQAATKALNRKEQDFAFYVLTLAENIYPFETTVKSDIIHKTQNQGKNVFLLQLSEEEKSIKEKLEITVRYSKKSFYGDYQNVWFKRPFFFEKSTTKLGDVYRRALRFINTVYVDSKHCKDVRQYEQKLLKLKPFTLILKWKKSIERYYGRMEIKFDEELEIENLDQTLDSLLLSKNLATKDCQFDIRFNKDGAKLFEFDMLKKVQDTNDKYSKKDSYKQKSKNMVTLDECFRFFEQKEQLEPGNEWYCPSCKDHKLATKQMCIYKAPQVLILHLKRFKNKGNFRKEKNQANVKFPMVLDLKDYLIDLKPMNSYIKELKKIQKYIEPVYNVEYNSESKPEYELFSISNHFGGLGGGHYTAYGKNDNKWYQFNDSSVHKVSQDDIKGSGAYMLFYRRINSMFIK